MGVLGCPTIYNWSYNFESNNFYFTSVCLNSLYHGIDWIYSTVETLYAYDFRVWYFWFFNSIFDDSFNYFFQTYWFFSLNYSSFQLFFSYILDLYTNGNLFKLPYTDDWFKNMLSSKEGSLLFIFHPELCFVRDQIVKNSYFLFFGEFIVYVYELLDFESFLTPVMLFPQLLFVIFFSVLLISFYFSYFTSSVREENLIDADYLCASGTVEAEKEIGSLDDILLGLIVIIYVFGWYFYVNCWVIASVAPELLLIFYLFPGLYYLIIGIPTFLIYDFGIFFLCYLRGVGQSSSVFMEFIYDCNGLIAFYVRILVQGVRLILMIFTYSSMHDEIAVFAFDQKIFFGSENLWDELNSISITLDSMSYFFLFSLPNRFIYWLYELFHTFFVVTVQFIAFFAMVFWLYLFLYTFFVVEQQEIYFRDKRAVKKKFLKTLYNFKN